jgi:short-subunit dehydrogenase
MCDNNLIKQNINFLGPAALTRSIAANMISHGGGAIGVVSSVQGKFGNSYRYV